MMGNESNQRSKIPYLGEEIEWMMLSPGEFPGRTRLRSSEKVITFIFHSHDTLGKTEIF